MSAFLELLSMEVNDVNAPQGFTASTLAMSHLRCSATSSFHHGKQNTVWHRLSNAGGMWIEEHGKDLVARISSVHPFWMNFAHFELLQVLSTGPVTCVVTPIPLFLGGEFCRLALRQVHCFAQRAAMGVPCVKGTQGGNFS